MGVATDLREALRPVVAFRGELEKCTTQEQLQLAVLEGDLPGHISKVLDLHQSLMLALALGARVEAERLGEVDLGRKIEKQVEVEKQEATKYVAPKSSFLDD